MSFPRPGLWSVLAFVVLASASTLHAAFTVDDVRWSASQFNPTIGARATISLELGAPAKITVRVIALDGKVVRTLTTRAAFDAGPGELFWDGRDDEGTIVADGAYVVEIDAVRRRSLVTHRSAGLSASSVIPVRYYDRRTGTIAYDLPAPSLVTIVANGKASEGAAVSKVVATSAARPGGAVIEAWNGFDDSGLQYIPDLPLFTIHIEARPMPTDAIIAYGARAAAPPAAPATTERGNH